MDILTRAVRAEIEERRARNPGRPDRELLEHVLVALQRERVVAVGFDTERLGERMARTRLPAAAQEISSPPEVCGSTSRLRCQSGRLSGRSMASP